MLLSSLENMNWVMLILWGAVFIITLIIELETADLTTIWFCFSSLITFICALTFATPIVQLIIFAVLSLILIIATKPLTNRFTKNEMVRTNADRVIGMIGVVTKEITRGEIGEVKVENSLWRAINNEGLTFEVGEQVTIDGIVGIKVVVSKLPGKSNVEII